MSWYWWMILGAALFGVARWWIADAMQARRTCSWCTRVSGNHVAGHTDDQCQAPRRDQELREQYESALKRQNTQQDQDNARRTATQAEQATRAAARLRLITVGTITTRTRTSGPNEIHVSGWEFDRSHEPGSEGRASSPTRTPYQHTGAPEAAHGWSLDELHAMAHGGSCRCDVVRLARNVC
ncbi:hypothetical protein [Streptomyces rubiginosohelvolus]|uniref:Secreted protein n=1 Tax=Streptomyces rubiginosohelvolus TaxID=67362 RepID=A0ABQ3CBT3_9ACTN|nr:hypothetical protein [Streptomyces pluricolorescens]GGZ83780.1 hypothetical protein GCM10010328_67510 [Streptomyces pluricolorescens]